MTERKLRPAVKTTRDSVQTGNTTIDFEVRRSRRRKKGASLKITDDGLRVLVPWRATRDQVRRLVLESSAWIQKNLAEHKQRPRLRFVTGETLPYVGRDLTLHIDPSGTEATRSTPRRRPAARIDAGTPAGRGAPLQNPARRQGLVLGARRRTAGTARRRVVAAIRARQEVPRHDWRPAQPVGQLRSRRHVAV